MNEPLLDNEARRPWATFLGGRWVLGFPKRPGLYPVAALDGGLAGYRTVVASEGGLVQANLPHRGRRWEGYWWSHPIPDLPRGPE